jgi:signal transduction histidine kinase
MAEAARGAAPAGFQLRKMTTSHLLQALAKLNQIGAVINQQGGDDPASLEDTLRMIVSSAAEVVPGSSAVIYTYDEAQDRFEAASHATNELVGMQGSPVESGLPGWRNLDDTPRPDGMGMRAIRQNRRVISYEEADLEVHPAKLALGAKAVACYPLYTAGEALGVLYIYLRTRRSFKDLELLMLDNFVNLTAMTLAAARRFTQAQQEQSRKEKELRRLRRAGMLISSRTSLKDTLEVILRMSLEVMDARYGIFRLVDKSGKNLVTQAIVGERLGKPAVETLPINDQSIMGLVAMRREPLVISDLHEEPWKHIYYPFDHELVMRSELAVPLIGAGGRMEGVLNLESPQLNAFSKQDKYILQILATHAVTAIQEARLLDALQEISALLLTLPQAQMHRSLVEKACDLLNVPASMIWLVEEQQLVLQAVTGLQLSKERLNLENTASAKAVLGGEPVTVSAAEFNRSPAYDDLALLGEGGSAMIVPLVAGEDPPEKPIGAFAVYSAPSENRDFDQSEWDKKVLSILSHYAVLAVQNTAHQEALRAVQEQRAVAEAFAAVGDIASNLMHRLNNKIGTIPVRVEGIQDKCQPSLSQDPYLAMNLEEIERSASAAMEVMQETVYHLRPIQFSEVTIEECVREALATAQLPPGVQVNQIGLESLPRVYAGTRRLTLVFVNLLENAVDAMGGEGTIDIRGEVYEKWIEIRFSDNGPGIPPDLQDRIFEFNYSTRESPGKLGFGLWWVKTLVARFGGGISVESDGRAGTTFILSLPRKDPGS